MSKILAESAPTIIKAILAALPSLIEGISEAIQILIQSMPDIVRALAEGMPLVIETLAREFGPIIAELIRAIPEIIGILSENISPIVAGLVAGIVDALPVIIDALINDFLLGGGLERVIVALNLAGPRIAQGIVIGLLSRISPASLEWGKFMGQGFLDTAMQALTGLFGGLAEIFRPIIAALESIRNSINNARSGGGGGFFSTGGNVGGVAGQLGGAAAGLNPFAKGGTVLPRLQNGGLPMASNGVDGIIAQMNRGEMAIDRSTSNAFRKFVANGGLNQQGGKQEITIRLVGEGGLADIINEAQAEGTATGTGTVKVAVGSED